MGRIRTVKPELFKHSSLYDAEQQYKLPLRIAFVGLFSCCDREGRFKWRPRELKLDILPYDDVDFEVVLNAFHECGFIGKYMFNNGPYGYIPSWHKHQVINNKERMSELPAPPICNSIAQQARVVDASGTRQACVLDAYPQQLGNTQGEGKGKEGKGTIYVCDSDSLLTCSEEAMTSVDPVLDVFTHWQTTMLHPKAILDSKRQNKIKWALKNGFTVEQLKLAIDGCAKSAWHMGKNDKGQIYDGINTIFSDAERIEKFISFSAAEIFTEDTARDIVRQIDQIMEGAINV